MEITELLSLCIKNNASDLHISAGMPPMMRIDGKIKKLDFNVLSNKKVNDLIYSIMNDEHRKIYENVHETDFSFEIPNISRFRINVFKQQHGMSAAFRIIPLKVLTFEQLQAPEIFQNIAENSRGLVLVTGPAGVGKTTTLAAIIDYINKTRANHILTIEDPIEFVHTSNKSLISQREVYRDTVSFTNALRSALREDPDVILVGEMRDLETIRLALTAAETGHLVFATLHTTSAAKTVDRIIDVFPAGEKDMVRSMISESLRAVVSQTLLECNSGGRIAAYEIMIANAAIRNLIRESKIAQIYSIIQTGRDKGMQTLDQSLQTLVNKGKINKQIARYKAENKDLFD